MWIIFPAVILISGAVAQNENFPCWGKLTYFEVWYNNTDCAGRPLVSVCGDSEIGLKREISSENKPTREDELLSVRVLGTNQFTFTTESNQSYISYVIGYEPNGTKCLALNDMIPLLQNWDDYRLNHTQRFRSTYSPSQLFFMEEINYQGKFHWVALDDIGIGSGYPITARSYIHVSNDAWVIYRGKLYTGEVTCFCPETKTSKATEVRESNVNLIVGSVKKDTEGICDCGKDGGDGGNGGNGPGGNGSRQIPNFLNFIIVVAFVRHLSLER